MSVKRRRWDTGPLLAGQSRTVNLQKYDRWYAEASTPMKQRKVLVVGVRVDHRLFRSIESASLWKLDPTQSQLTGNLELLCQDLVRSMGEKEALRTI